MCTDDEHQGLIPDAALTRRRFLAAAGTVVAGTLAAPALADKATARPVATREVMVPTLDGEADAVLCHPEGKGRWPAVLVWTDILGLRLVFRELGERLAAEGYTVLVPNPFYRSQRAPVVDGSFDFANPEHRKRVFALRAAMTVPGIIADAAAYVRFLDRQPQTDTRRPAGVQGYCMGGSLSFWSALVADRIAAVASFHGGGLVTAEPESPHLQIAKTRAEYLVAVARNDDAREPAAKDTLKAAFAAAHRPATVEVYAADHGWCVFGSQSYQEAEAERAWTALLALYARRLKSGPRRRATE